MPFYWTNPAASTLASNGGSITNSATSFNVADGSTWPVAGPYVVLIGTELILVKSRSTNAITTYADGRGWQSTTAATHNDGDAVTPVLDASGLRGLVRGGRPPNASDFSWVNQSGAVLATTDGVINVTKTLAASGSISGQFCSRPSAAPWSVTLTVVISPGFGSSTGAGVGFRDSSGGKLTVVNYFRETDVLRVDHLNSATSFNGNAYGGINFGGFAYPLTLTLGDDSTNIYVDILDDGLNAQRFYSEGRTSFLGAAPDQVGVYVYDNTYSTGKGSVSLLAYQAN